MELLNPENVLAFGSDYASGSRKFGSLTPVLYSRGDQTPTHGFDGDGEHLELHDNGVVVGIPDSVSNGDISKLNRRLSFDSMVDERMERLSIAESEGFPPIQILIYVVVLVFITICG